MIRYRTEVVIPPDRFVGLQLPADLPEGRAVVTVVVEVVEPDEPGPPEDAILDPEGEDIEWWDEFGDEADDDPNAILSSD